jgi:precorrin-6B methylase 2
LQWQYPNQFSKYLAELAAHPVDRYLEIGVRHGGTFVITVEYLSRFHPVREAIAVDLEGPVWCRTPSRAPA